MILSLPPKAHHQAIQAAPAPPASSLSPVEMIIAAVCLVLVLWLAYRIGTVILRLAAGIFFLCFAAYGIWYLFLR